MVFYFTTFIDGVFPLRPKVLHRMMIYSSPLAARRLGQRLYFPSVLEGRGSESPEEILRNDLDEAFLRVVFWEVS